MQKKEVKSKNEEKDDKKAKWKEQHEKLIQAIRISKKMKEVEENGGDPELIRQLASQIP